MTTEKLTTTKILPLLILVAFPFIYIGVNVSWLAFLPTVGVAILLGIIYWEKREHTLEACQRLAPSERQKENTIGKGENESE